jgi:hypothetical protein
MFWTGLKYEGNLFGSKVSTYCSFRAVLCGVWFRGYVDLRLKSLITVHKYYIRFIFERLEYFSELKLISL